MGCLVSAFVTLCDDKLSVVNALGHSGQGFGLLDGASERIKLDELAFAGDDIDFSIAAGRVEHHAAHRVLNGT